MQVEIRIEDQSYRVSIGKGYNDFVWLAHYGARIYSRHVYPHGCYIPTMLSISRGESGEMLYPHPRERIKYYLEEYGLNVAEMAAIVNIRKANHIYSEGEKRWEREAYGKDRYMMRVRLRLLYVGRLEKKEGDYFVKAKLHYTMLEDIKHLFQEKDYDYQLEEKLEKVSGPDGLTRSKTQDKDEHRFEKFLQLPMGTVTAKFFFCKKEEITLGLDEFKEIELLSGKTDNRRIDIEVQIEPKIVPLETINTLVSEEMRISDTISKSIFEQLWNLVEESYGEELLLGEYEATTKDRVKIYLEKAMNGLYEIFFYYFILENQQKDKKEDLGVTYQDVMHFLRDYHLIPEHELLLSFLEYYNSDGKFTSLRDTLEIRTHCIKFPQFIAILLRSIQFAQASAFIAKGDTFDLAVQRSLDKVLERDLEEDDFTPYRRNLRENIKIMSFMRTQCDPIKAIFLAQATASIQNSAALYVLMKEEIKAMLELAQLTKKCTDRIVQDCFIELQLLDSGIFYYEFLQVLQWLALAVITSEKKEERNPPTTEEETLALLDKIKFLIDKLLPH